MKTSPKRDLHEHAHEQTRFAVLPTPVRLDANPDRTGKGVTIAFLDSGFYTHPDLTRPRSRILARVDITAPDGRLRTRKPNPWDWHGTQTSVVAAGNGYLSDGFYNGLASEAKVVLVKVSERGRINDEHIARGIRWVIENKDRYKIRVVSISLGGDEDASFEESLVDQAAEEAVRQGLVLVVAAGNTGCQPNHYTIPPANSPSVITVGGYDDNNQLRGSNVALYCSNFGRTIDGLIKPDLIAPAIWVAAPILPDTEAYHRAEALSQIASAANARLHDLTTLGDQSDHLLSALAADVWEKAELPAELRDEPLEVIRAVVESRLEAHKIIATHYQHVDGTSFAAPIVASVVAQMIEANPELTPAAVKHILISTADRIPDAPAIRQGYGVLNAWRAVAAASREHPVDRHYCFSPPRIDEGRLIFTYLNDAAQSVALAGDFNGWNPAQSPFIKQKSGLWQVEMDTPPVGRYHYKFVVDGWRWLEDPSNELKEADRHNGFNSVLNLARSIDSVKRAEKN